MGEEIRTTGDCVHSRVALAAGIGIRHPPADLQAILLPGAQALGYNDAMQGIIKQECQPAPPEPKQGGGNIDWASAG